MWQAGGPGRFYGPCSLRKSGKSDQKNLNYLVVGPWNHGGWAHGPGNALGEFPLAPTQVFISPARWKRHGSLASEATNQRSKRSCRLEAAALP